MGFWDKLMGRQAGHRRRDQRRLDAKRGHAPGEGWPEDRAESAEAVAQDAREEAAEHEVKKETES